MSRYVPSSLQKEQLALACVVVSAQAPNLATIACRHDAVISMYMVGSVSSFQTRWVGVSERCVNG